MTAEQTTYQNRRRKTWNAIARSKLSHPTGVFYHQLLTQYYQFIIPPGRDILELGCGCGNLLATLKPAAGVGVDSAHEMLLHARRNHPGLCFIRGDAHNIKLNKKFDVIILSDLINDLWDIQTVFENLRHLCHPGTRVILNFFNNMWRLPILAARRFNLADNLLEQNWLAPEDVKNLLYLSGFESIKFTPWILLPVNCGIISTIANRLMINIWPLNWFSITNFLVARPACRASRKYSDTAPKVSVIIPARNEAGNIAPLLNRTSLPQYQMEFIFVEGHSKDDTYNVIQNAIKHYSDKNCKLIKQTGSGKGDAVRAGFNNASGEILIILDADLTVAPEDLSRFIDALASGKGDFINGVRLVYPMEGESMRFLNMVANKIFGLLFSWVLGQPVKDTLCGTKALWKKDYELIEKGRKNWNTIDPFGDFDLLLGAARMNLKIVDLPIRYRRRQYGDTNIKRWQHGWILIKMMFVSLYRFKISPQKNYKNNHQESPGSLTRPNQK